MSVNAVTAYLIENLSTIKGKKAFQKLIYLTKAVGVPLNESYRMYYYGPYSDQVAEELEDSFSNRVLEKVEDTFNFRAGANTKQVLGQNEEFICTYRNNLDKVIHSFGQFDPMTLEILATTHFIYNNMKHLYNITDKNSIIDEVKKAKYPKFDELKIEEAYNKLLEEGLISPN